MGIRAKLYWDKHSLADKVHKRKVDRLCQVSCEFYRKYRDKQPEDYTNDELIEDWRKVFNSVLKYFGFNRHSRNFLFYTLCEGNWKHLHMTKKEEYYTETQWLSELAYDVFYCSDRWSFDRLMRNHWAFRNALRRRFVLFPGEYDKGKWW